MPAVIYADLAGVPDVAQRLFSAASRLISTRFGGSTNLRAAHGAPHASDFSHGQQTSRHECRDGREESLRHIKQTSDIRHTGKISIGKHIRHSSQTKHLALAVLLTIPLFAQGPKFESADVHASSNAIRETSGFYPDGRFECRGTPLLKIIAEAYNVDTDLLAGGPEWLGSDGFDITAKAASRKASPEELRQMLQDLLAERFGLVVHSEQRDVSVYLLRIGKRGPKLHQANATTVAECPAVQGRPGMNHRDCRGFSMADLSHSLPQIARNYVDKPVLDATGLTGRYDFQLDWMGKPGYLTAKANSDGPAVSLYDALDQLGLKLEPGSRPQPVIVVDYVNRWPKEYAPSAVTSEFEAAEVRPSKPGAAESLTARNGRLEILGFTLRNLITMALDTKADLVAGNQKFLDTDRFDVIAKSADVSSPHTVSAMLKTLIVQRFQLATHQEKQPVTVFALVAGKNPKLQKTSGSPRSECRSRLGEGGLTCVCQNTTMAQLAERLSAVAGAYIVHPLVDLTGIEGAYDFALTWTPKAKLSNASTGRPAIGNDLTVFEAVDKQLGLKIEEQKHPMMVTVIDHVERTPLP
jgi:uncharacterized protein (TIGR03435 family)